MDLFKNPTRLPDITVGGRKVKSRVIDQAQARKEIFKACEDTELFPDEIFDLTQKILCRGCIAENDTYLCNTLPNCGPDRNNVCVIYEWED